MPIVRENTAPLSQKLINFQDPPPDNSLGFFDTIGDAFNLENRFVGDIRAAAANIRGERRNRNFDPDFDPFEGLEAQYWGDAKRFVHANDAAEVAAIKNKIDIERERRERVYRAGWEGMAASMLAGFFDYDVALALVAPGIGTSAKTAKTLSTAQRALRGARDAALLGSASSVISEIHLHEQQLTRTEEESVANVLGSLLLSGILGGTVGAVMNRTGKSREQLAKELYEDLRTRPEEELDIFEPNYGDMVGGGAALVRQTTPEQDTLVDALIPGLNEFIRTTAQSPGLKAALSKSHETRKIVQRLVETPFLWKKNLEGIASPVSVETKMRRHEAIHAQWYEMIDRNFLEYRFGSEGMGAVRHFVEQHGGLRAARIAVQGADRLRTKAKGNRLGYEEFKNRVAFAMRRNDEDSIPLVARSARDTRAMVFDPLFNRARNAGLVGDDIGEGNDFSYLTRIYDVDKIKANENDFAERVFNWLRRSDPGEEEIILRNDARAIVSAITSQKEGRISYESLQAGQRGAHKSRTLAIPTIDIEEYIEKDLDKLVAYYFRTYVPDVELVEEFGGARAGDALDALKGIIRDSHKQRKDDVTAAIEEKISKGEKVTKRELAARDLAISKIDRQLTSDIDAIAGMFDRLRGIYGVPEDPASFSTQMFRSMRDVNYYTALGGQTLSAIPDLGRSIMTEGLYRNFKHGFIPMIRQILSWDLSTYRKMGEEIERTGNALDLILDSRAKGLYEIGDNFANQATARKQVSLTGAMVDPVETARIAAGKAVELSRQGSNVFGLVSLMSPWNQAVKKLSGMVVVSRIIDTSTAWKNGKISKKDMSKLAQVGIDEDMARRIADQFEKHGGSEKNVRLPNRDAWDDLEASDALANAIGIETNKVIITPGAGDAPLFLSTEFGKLILQFMNFVFGANNKMLLSGLQTDKASFLSGAIVMVTLGALSTHIKDLTAGREVERSTSDWIQEGIDRSGILGSTLDIHNRISRASEGNLSLNNLFNDDFQSSRMSARTKYGALLGPSAGLFENAVDAAGVFDGDIGASEIRGARRLMYGQNLFYLRALFDEIQEGAIEVVE